MLYVVDASVVIERLVRGPYTPNATALFKETANYLYAPEFCRLECVNVLWKHVRFQGMPQSKAELLANDLLALPIIPIGVTAFYLEALQIGLTYQLAVYDSLYLALAKQLKMPLISIDQPQIKAATAEGISIKPVTDF